MSMKEGDRFDSVKELPNGKWIDVTMKVDEVERLDDGSEVIHSSLTEESQEAIQQKLRELDHPAADT